MSMIVGILSGYRTEEWHSISRCPCQGWGRGFLLLNMSVGERVRNVEEGKRVLWVGERQLRTEDLMPSVPRIFQKKKP